MNNDQQQTEQTLNYQVQTQTTGQTIGQQTMQAAQTAQTVQYTQTAQAATTQYNQVAGQTATTTTQGTQTMQYQQQVANQETMQMNPKIGSFNELYDQQGATSARNQQLTTTTNQKGGVGTAILIVILFLALIGLVGYIIYTKGNNNKTDNTRAATTTNVNLSIDDEKVINSYGVITSSYFDQIKGSYFVGKSITAKDIPNDTAYVVAATDILKDKNMGVLDDGASFTVEELNKKVDELYGTDYELPIQHYGCPIYDYNEATQTFTKSELGCGFEAKENVLFDQVVMAEEKDNELNVYVRVLYGTYNFEKSTTTYFSDYGKTNAIGEFYDNKLSLSDIAKGSLYKLTFAEKEGTFQFKSSELVS